MEIAVTPLHPTLKMPFVHLGTLVPFRKAEYQLSPHRLPPPCIFNGDTRALDK